MAGNRHKNARRAVGIVVLPCREVHAVPGIYGEQDRSEKQSESRGSGASHEFTSSEDSGNLAANV